MDKIKRFIDVYIPTETCNLQCSYCYIAQKGLFTKQIAHFTHTPEEIRKAFSQKKLGGTCLLNLCAGGETLLSPEVLPVVHELAAEGHYVMIVTNGTVTKAFEQVAGWEEEIKKRLFFKFSFHYVELKRLNLLDRFTGNVSLVKNAGCSFTVEVTPSDELIPYIDELKEYSLSAFGAYPHFTIARNGNSDNLDLLTDLSEEEYVKTFGQFDSALFDYKMELYHKKRNEFCYAGCWSLYINLGTGDIIRCYRAGKIGNIYDDEVIDFSPIGHCCTLPYCFNGHAFLAFGDIPGVDTTNFMQIRDRVDSQGNHWVNETMQSMFESKLYESNPEFTPKEMKAADKRVRAESKPTLKEQIGKTFIYSAYKKLLKK